MTLSARLRRFSHWHEVLLACLLAGLLVVAGILDPVFVRFSTQVELSTQMWEMAIVALPMTLVIITAGIDLSVGSTMALCAVILGLLFEAGCPVWIAAAVAILAGIVAGLLNGWFVAKVKVHPLIVTLATLSAYRGIAEGISLGRPISGFPEAFCLLSRGQLLGVPIPGIIFAIAAVFIAILLAKSVLGRQLYIIGHNETAGRFSGIPVDRVKLMLYALSGLSAAVAAVLFVARRNTAKADVGESLALDAITAVVLGGTSIFGGRGNITGTLLGILLIHETRQFVSWRWNNDELNLIVIGSLLIVSVLVHSLLSRKQPRQG